MTDDRKDVNDMHREGTLPAHPSHGTERVAALRVVKPDERRATEPADVAAERALVGALLWAAANAPDVLRSDAVADILETGEPFYDRRLGDAYEACRATRAAGAEHDAVAVAGEMARSGKSGGLGVDGLEAIKDGASTVSVRQARVYAQRIRDMWARRTLIADTRRFAEDARDPKTDPAALLQRAQAIGTVFAQRSAAAASTVHISHSLAVFMSSLSSGKNTAITTGLRDVDQMTNGGLRPLETSILAARPGIGKSLIAAQWGEAMTDAEPSAVTVMFTLEMRHEMYAARLLSARSGVPMQNFRRVVINQTQWTAIHRAAIELTKRGIYFADSPSQTLAQVFGAIGGLARTLAVEGKRIGLVVLDHVGLIKPSAEALKRASREQQVAETSRALRAISTEYHCHTIGIAHINRTSEAGVIPGIHQLRESGALEGDADNVFILHRERDPKTQQFVRDKPAALALAKGRLDETGVCLLDFDGQHQRFTDSVGGSE